MRFTSGSNLFDDDDFCLIIWAISIIVFTHRDEHSQGEHPHN